MVNTIFEWNIFNLKLSLKTPPQSRRNWIDKIKADDRWTWKNYGNFIIIFLPGSLRFSVFFPANLSSQQTVNLTGTSTTLETKIAIERLSRLFGWNKDQYSYKVESVTFRYIFPLSDFSLEDLSDLCVKKGIAVRLNPEKFPGCIVKLRTQQYSSRKATVIVYRSGKVIVFGCTCYRECYQTMKKIKYLLVLTSKRFETYPTLSRSA
jgi:hypothetical protein